MERLFTPENYRRLARYFGCLGIRDGQTIADVGANIGYTALLYAEIFPASTIVAVEPSKRNQTFLRHNCRSHPMIVPVAFGADEVAGKATLRRHRWQDAHAAEKAPDTGFFSMFANGSVVEVIQLRTLDHILAENSRGGPVTFVKIDVEGNELSVLRGATKLLLTQGPAVEVEINPMTISLSGMGYGAIRDFLSTFGYRPFRFDGRDLVPVTNESFDHVVNLTFVKEGVRP